MPPKKGKKGKKAEEDWGGAEDAKVEEKMKNLMLQEDGQGASSDDEPVSKVVLFLLVL